MLLLLLLLHQLENVFTDIGNALAFAVHSPSAVDAACASTFSPFLRQEGDRSAVLLVEPLLQLELLFFFLNNVLDIHPLCGCVVPLDCCRRDVQAVGPNLFDIRLVKPDEQLATLHRFGGFY